MKRRLPRVAIAKQLPKTISQQPRAKLTHLDTGQILKSFGPTQNNEKYLTNRSLMTESGKAYTCGLQKLPEFSTGKIKSSESF